jgi:hypothetical protein
MSYLNPPRLNFFGKFRAAPSTVNNDPKHFKNESFDPNDGWWNPNGDAAWRLIGCKVTGAWVAHDKSADENDPILKCHIGDSDRSAPAKIVDLDPEQQTVSEIWGLQVRISLADGTDVLRARYQTAAFTDIWSRSTSGGGDMGAGAMYQSVLTDLQWGDISASPFLKALKQMSDGGLLSIKFNVDGYNQDSKSADFTRGRIVGTIGPASASEPRHFVVGRHFMASPAPSTSFFKPAGQVNFCTAVVDEKAGKIILDLGNALPTDKPGGSLTDLGTLSVGYPISPTSRSAGAAPVVLFDKIDYRERGWYETTAGIVTIPAKRALTKAELAEIGGAPLVMTSTDVGGSTRIAIAEAPNGTFVRADRFVFRLNPGETTKVRLYASQWGKPYSNARVISVIDPLQLQHAIVPAKGSPAPTEVVDFPSRLLTDTHGTAELPIRVSDPTLARVFIDGQVYGVRPMLEDSLSGGLGYNFNPSDFISLLVWGGFVEENPPTWFKTIKPIFQQYANLYPVMKPIVDLANYDSVCANVHILRLAFGLPIEDPNSMPVTRDLSDAKRKAILRWLSEPGSDGKPLKGTPGPAQAAPKPAPTAAGDYDAPMRGGKEMAASRRLQLRNRLR